MGSGGYIYLFIFIKRDRDRERGREKRLTPSRIVFALILNHCFTLGSLKKVGPDYCYRLG